MEANKDYTRNIKKIVSLQLINIYYLIYQNKDNSYKPDLNINYNTQYNLSKPQNEEANLNSAKNIRKIKMEKVIIEFLLKMII